MHRDCDRTPSPRPRYELADIVRAHGAALASSHALTDEQRRALWDIAHCRTAALGGHEDKCRDCGDTRQAYNSCCNRHCPKCQALAQDAWLERQMARMLPTGCFHVVLTLPSELRALARRNPRPLYDLLFHAGSEALLALGRDPKRLGGLIGITAVLHTWRRDQMHHPHLHCIVPGGALAEDPNGLPKWIDAGREHLFPVKVLSKLFRGKFLDRLTRLLDKGGLDLPPELTTPSARAALLTQLHQTRWVTYCKRPFAGPEQLYEYLGRYTHRVGLSNHRILHLDDEAVTISTRDGRTATMTPLQLLERFIQHVLPHRYVKIRHYGLHASSNLATRLPAAREAIERGHVEARGRRPVPPPRDWRERLKALAGVDLRRCAVCGGTRMERLATSRPPTDRTSRGPPDVAGPP